MSSTDNRYEMRLFDRSDATYAPSFIRKFQAATTDTPQAFFMLSPAQLLEAGSMFAVVLYDGEIVAGARAVLDGAPSVYVSQCFADPKHRGKRLVAVAVARLRDHFDRTHGVGDAHLVIRVIAGEPNRAALQAYLRLGFVPGEVIRRDIDPNDPISRHLAATADPDGKYSVLQMTASRDSLEGNREILRSFARCVA